MKRNIKPLDLITLLIVVICFLNFNTSHAQKIKKDSFEIWVIPHTLKLTNLINLKKNDLVNVEIDIMSKYVKKYINEKK